MDQARGEAIGGERSYWKKVVAWVKHPRVGRPLSRFKKETFASIRLAKGMGPCPPFLKWRDGQPGRACRRALSPSLPPSLPPLPPPPSLPPSLPPSIATLFVCAPPTKAFTGAGAILSVAPLEPFFRVGLLITCGLVCRALLTQGTAVARMCIGLMTSDRKLKVSQRALKVKELQDLSYRGFF